jgi:tryptophan 2,3-dioxygenase
MPAVSRSRRDAAPNEGSSLREPVLPGAAPSDYERYLRTDELLSLQRKGAEQVHRDELLFQVTHQSSELWLKLATSEVCQATRWVVEGRLGPAVRLLRRVTLALDYVSDQLGMLDELSPWEYQEIRRVLGRGSGFDSPGFHALRRSLPPLEAAFEARLAAERIDLVGLYTERTRHEDLYGLAEEMLHVDARLQAWRVRHYAVVARVIGDEVVGTQGTPVEVLGRLIHVVAFPKLWQVRNTLTALGQRDDG